MLEQKNLSPVFINQSNNFAYKFSSRSEAFCLTSALAFDKLILLIIELLKFLRFFVKSGYFMQLKVMMKKNLKNLAFFSPDN